ncbi:E3 ubiquitin-protein ligase MIB2 [Octopus bimaculoides]|uniref:RING-type E3 ubiquitin transferase n=1 Tax=Octopus bimaculoides TaxID=37653 RepID=A0A0L8FX87_OCTBM|nr:E3 ubiquitin-protein ligase MIB2 [Octopus bimaculoides]|eukprot:XP_014786080.1 PREDICTED: E3 ubiquitin-protein ligase MIB2-like [Octopus bimaculoides]
MDSNASTSVFDVGDRVSMYEDINTIKLLQEGHGGWNPFMANFIGQVGIVQGVNNVDDVIVKFEGLSKNLWRFNPKALTKIDKFSVGDAVKILDDIEQVKRYQINHGGWSPDMTSVLGKIGSVKIAFPDGDLFVSVSGKIFLFNPLCCTKVPQSMKVGEEDDATSIMEVMEQFFNLKTGFSGLLQSMQGIMGDSERQDDQFLVGETVKIIEDIQKVKAYQEKHGGWVDDMVSILGKTARVKLVLPNGALLVSVSGKMCSINPKCCRKVSRSVDDSESDSESVDDMMQQLFNMSFGATVLDGFVKEAAKGHTRNVREFIKNHRDEIDKKCSGKTALQVASYKGHKDIVLMLLEAGADLELQDDDGDTALNFSAIGGETEIMELLLSKGAKTNALNKNRHTALHIAVNKESVKCVRILVKHSAPINIQDSLGDTALHDAIRKENEEIIDMLISDSRIDFKIRNKRGFNTLHYAAIRGNNFATVSILQKCQDIVNVKKDDGFTALHLAALNGHREVANTLLSVGRAEINIKNSSGQTPLFLAATQGHIGLIELLILKGAEVNVEDEDGNICLHLAVSRQNVSISKDDLKIIENIRSQLGLDESERAEVVIACYLVHKGANPYYKNRQDVMPLDIMSDQSLIEKLVKVASLSTEQPCGAQIEERRSNNKDCMLCSNKQATVLFQPCCHVLICEHCNVRVPVKHCLQCKVLIADKITIHDPQQKRIEELEERVTCPICMDRPRNMAFECGHTVCKECGESLKECHMCSKPIQKKLNLY